jgi:cob(I)alamin adenosyltransferase
LLYLQGLRVGYVRSKMTCYTRSGDSGNTCVIGTRVDKGHDRLEAIGTFDELNAALGTAVAFTDAQEIKSAIEQVQNDLFTLCSELATISVEIPTPKITASHVYEMEHLIDRLESQLPAQDKFIIPGGTKAASLLQLARTVTRRAERSLVRLNQKDSISPELLKYANRLSSLLYMLARLENRNNNINEKNPVYRK